LSSRFLIFGGSGFVGRRIVQHLQEIKADVHAPKVDLRDPAKIKSVLAEVKPTHVINAAAKGVDPTTPVDSGEIKAVNFTGAVALQEECGAAGVERLIHLGSCFEYGSHDGAIEESFALNPTTPYARAKAEASMALLERAGRFQTQTLVLRLFGVWGPGEKPHRLVPQILAAARSRQPVSLTHGKQIRDFSFVDDMAGDIVTLSQCAAAKNAVVNVGSGHGLSVLEFAFKVASALGCEDLLKPGALPPREGEMARLVASTKKLSTLIQIKPRTPVEIGLSFYDVIA
jgi:nucleoside-diphosphate-sugar epimerase